MICFGTESSIRAMVHPPPEQSIAEHGLVLARKHRQWTEHGLVLGMLFRLATFLEEEPLARVESVYSPVWRVSKHLCMFLPPLLPRPWA